MAASMNHVILMCIFTAASSIQMVSSSSSSSSSSSMSTCHPQLNTLLNDLQFQCPLSISPSSPIEMDGDSLDRALSSSPSNVYSAVLFYASWCPFSCGARSKFDVLSAMFPQIRHLAVEQSLAVPRIGGSANKLPCGRFWWSLKAICFEGREKTKMGVFSRYGIHSLPSILMVNQTTKVWYYGRKDLHSLARFYKRTTGLEPVEYFSEDQPSCSGSDEDVLLPWNGSSLSDILMKEPFLVFSVLFLCLRAFLYFFPEMLSRLTALWVAYVPHLNLGIFGESSQLFWRVLHLIDVKRVWSKLKLCKTRNFHKGAKSARVWASSLASVSLGETSSARSSPPGDS